MPSGGDLRSPHGFSPGRLTARAGATMGRRQQGTCLAPKARFARLDRSCSISRRGAEEVRAERKAALRPGPKWFAPGRQLERTNARRGPCPMRRRPASPGPAACKPGTRRRQVAPCFGLPRLMRAGNFPQGHARNAQGTSRREQPSRPKDGLPPHRWGSRRRLAPAPRGRRPPASKRGVRPLSRARARGCATRPRLATQPSRPPARDRESNATWPGDGWRATAGRPAVERPWGASNLPV